MPASLNIISPGVYTTIQDIGRPGYLNIGVPPSGALDPVSLRLANFLVGNDQTSAALEILYQGPEFIVDAESVRLALVGEGCCLEVLEPEAFVVPEGQSVTLQRNSRCRVSTLSGSSSAYLAAAGGFDIEPVMGSGSTYVRGGFGGYQGALLEAGDNLPISLEHAPERQDLYIENHSNPLPDGPLTIRVVLGPQPEYFTEKGHQAFFGEIYTCSQSSDRMGIRLDGPVLEMKNFEGLISDGIVAGAIQVPGQGLPIILLKDHQTSGGYPKIATVISTDLPVLGRVRPGQKLKFSKVEVDEAEDLYRSLEKKLNQIMKSARPVSERSKLEIDQLYSANLISGMVDAATERSEI